MSHLSPSSFLVLLCAATISSAASANRGVGNSFFASAGRRGSSWTLNVQISSTPESEYLHDRRQRISRSRSANVALTSCRNSHTRGSIDKLRGGSDGRGSADGDSYYGYNNNNYEDDRDAADRNDYGRGDYYGGDYNDHGSSSGRYGSSQQPPEREDEYYRRDDDDRYREDDYYGYGQYNDRRSSSGSRRKPKKSSSLSSIMPDVFRKGNKKWGTMMLGGGTALTALGMTLFFNKGLMRMGNLLFVGGVPMFIGPSRTIRYFLNPAKARATSCVVAGMFLVFVGWPIFGILLESFGLLNLFGNMFPIAMTILRTLPGVSALFPKNKNNGRGSKNKRKSYDDYGDDPYDRYHDGGQDDGDDIYGYGEGGGGGGSGGYY